MPAKGKGQPEKKVMLGRPSTNVKIGLVGLPNVGKSSLFNLLGNLQVAAENYPFCTIDPSDTKVVVPDRRFKHLVTEFKPKKEIPAVLNVTDIAGLVKGAAEGKGLGNAFLSHIQAVDAIYHVTRAFVKKDIEHVEGNVDPVRDFEIIRGELAKKDLAWMNGYREAFKKKCRAKITKEQENEINCFTKVIEMLEEGKEPRHADWSGREIGFINQWPLLTSKPVVYLVNISLMNQCKSQNKWFKDIKEWVAKNGGEPVIPFSVAFEEKMLAINDMDAASAETAKKALMEKFSIKALPKSMIPKIIKSGYQALRFINFFTVGADEVRAWSIREGTNAPGAAGAIHGDFEKHFVKAEVYNYDAFKEFKSEKGVKDAGKLMTKGKDYEVKDGDIMFIKHNAGGAKK